MAKGKDSYLVAQGLFGQKEKNSPNISTEKTNIELNENTAETQGREAITKQSDGLPQVPFVGTQGRKGEKLRRMNVPVTDKEYEAIRKGSRAAGMTYGEYIYAAVTFYQANGEGKP